MKDYYYILGIDKAATTEQIKHAYRKLSNKFHPDKNDGDKFFEERFKEIQEAYETLSNLNRKKTYDSNFNNNNFKSNNHNSNNSYEEKIRKDFEDELRKRKKEYEEDLKLKEKKHKEEIDDLKNQINQKRHLKNIAFIPSKKRIIVALLFIFIAVALIYLISNFNVSNNTKVLIDSTATTTITNNPKVLEKSLVSDSTSKAIDWNTIPDDAAVGDSISKTDSLENNNAQQIPVGIFKIKDGYDCAIETSKLEIGALINNKFKFTLAVDNSHWYSGRVNGVAKIIGKNLAVFKDYKKCMITFHFQNNNVIELQESDCGYYHGANICFSGVYELNNKPQNEEVTDQTLLDQLNSDEPQSQQSLKNRPKYHSYCNDRYGYCIDYPDNLIPQPIAANNDGRGFKDNVGNEVLSVYGTHHVDENGVSESIQTLYQSELKRKSSARVITYNKVGKGAYIISGTVNGKIFYQKTIQLRDGFGYAILVYSENEKSFYNVVSEHLNNSFKPFNE